MVIALLGIMMYVWVARKYQNRQRDEPDNTATLKSIMLTLGMNPTMTMMI